MRIHTDHLVERDIRDALSTSGVSGDGVWVEMLPHGSRTRHHAFEVALRATEGRDRNGKKRRRTNSGSYGAGSYIAATYDEWGYWLADLFERDPEMVATYYSSRQDFHEKTAGKYRPVTSDAR